MPRLKLDFRNKFKSFVWAPLFFIFQILCDAFHPRNLGVWGVTWLDFGMPFWDHHWCELVPVPFGHHTGVEHVSCSFAHHRGFGCVKFLWTFVQIINHSAFPQEPTADLVRSAIFLTPDSSSGFSHASNRSISVSFHFLQLSVWDRTGVCQHWLWDCLLLE